MKKVMCGILAIIAVLCITISAYAEGEMYSHLTIVVDKEQTDENMWLIYCEDKSGDIWAFYADEDEWEPGDICNLLIKCTEEDEEIIEVYWEGYIENLDLFFFLTEWR